VVTGSGSAGTQVVLAGSAAYGSATSYVCYGSDNANHDSVVFSYTDGTHFTPVSVDPGDSVRFTCIGN
jgi:hypothetical protein